MFLKNKKDNRRICDFQLEYACDCRLMLDFYAYAQIKEPANLGIPVDVEFIDYGMVGLTEENYFILENYLKEKMKNIQFLKEVCSVMIDKTTQLIQNCNILEEKMQSGKYTKQELYKTFDKLVDVISYRRLADMASDYLGNEIGKEKISSLQVPSYLLLLKENFEKLGHSSTDEDFYLYINEYAYLNGFDIRKNKFEDINYLKQISSCKKECKKIRKMDLKYTPLSWEDDKIQIFHAISWYSELKHIYQLRVLRNFRIYFEENNLDIQLMDARSIFQDVHQFRRDWYCR